MAHAILTIGLIVFLAYLFLEIFQRTRVPDVLLLIVVGIVLGPHGLGLVSTADFGQVGPALSTIALIVVLLLGGIELDLRVLRSALAPTLVLTLLTYAVTSALVTLIGAYILGLSWLLAAAMGAMLGGTSSAVVIPLIARLGLPGYSATILTLESALTDVLTVVFVASMIQAASADAAALQAGALLVSVVASFVVAGLIGVAAAIGWLIALGKSRHNPDEAIATIAFALLIYGVTELLAFSGPIAVLAFGLTLSNRLLMRLDRLPLLRRLALGELGPRERDANSQVQFILKVFFFVFLGIAIPFKDVWLVALATITVAVIFGARHLIVWLTADRRRVGWDSAAALCALVPKGLAAAVLAAHPLQLGLPGGEVIEQFAFMVVFISIVTTALLIPAAKLAPVERLYRAMVAPVRGSDQPGA